MNNAVFNRLIRFALAAALVLMFAADGFGAIPTVKGPTFNLQADNGYVTTPDGGAYLMWLYGVDGGTVQYTGPVLDVNEGDNVTVNLTNNLPVATSIVFPGQMNVGTSGGSAGLLTAEAAASGGTVTYTFEATEPGTYMYHSGTNPGMQVEMGLVGALIVRPAGQPAEEKWAYNHADSRYDYEYLFVLTEMDPAVHDLVLCNLWHMIDLTAYFPVLWFINGRNAPDTMLRANNPMLPTQPLNCLPRMHPGDRMLLRFVGGGRDIHPFHPHGNNMTLIARDARLLSSGLGGAGADLAVSNFTLAVGAGMTADAIFEWTGEKLGWDIYGHDPCDPLADDEYADDHGKPFPVQLPDQKDLTFGQFYGGSPFLGVHGALPPGQGGFNLNAGYFYMWHSHNEKELTNNDIFPGGIMTMLIIEPPGVVIE